MWQDRDYLKVLIVPFALTLSHSSILWLVVSLTLIASAGGMTDQPVINDSSSLYTDVNIWFSESFNIILTGHNYCPDLLFLIHFKCLHNIILEPTGGFESYLKHNAEQKIEKCFNLVKVLRSKYKRGCKYKNEK